MIPATYPSVLDATNRTKMVVYELPSITGLTRWVDYIPVKSPASESDTSLANTYANAGFILSNALTSVTGLQAFKDYIPIYVDNAATVPWTTDANGYIPLSDLFSISSLFANNEQGLWYDPSDINTYMSELGSELITNGDFSTDTAWTKQSGWTISGGTANVDSSIAGTTSLISTGMTVTVGKVYKVTYTILSVTGSGIRVGLGGDNEASYRQVAGTYTIYFVAITTAGLEISASSINTVGSVDNVSVKEVTSIVNATMFQDAAGTIPVTTVEQPVGLIIDKRKGGVLNPQLVTNSTFDTDTAWTKGTGWTIGSGVATKTAGTASTLSQSESFVVGKTYRIVYTITRTAGTLTPLFTGGGIVSGSARTASGTYVDFMTAVTGNNLLNFSADASFAGTIDNVYMREITGNDGYQLTSASRPTLSARYNLLTFTEQFDNAVWAKNAINVSSNSVASPTGTLTADTLTCTALTSSFYVSQSSNTAGANLTNTVSCYLKSNTAQYAYVSLSANTTTTYWATAVVDLTSGTITQTTNGAGVSGAVSSIINLGNGWYKVTVTGTFGAVANNFGIVVGISNTATPTMAGYGIYSWTASGTESIYVWGGDARIANDGVGLPNYQRVNTATDYDTTSFPPYLFYDGTDDHLIGQPNLDLSAGDKVTVWAGQRKLRDTGQPAIISNVLTPTGTNIFTLYAPNGVSVSYRFTNTGTLSASAGNSIFASAPRTNVLTAIGDISGDITTLRVDGVLHQTVNTDLGTGNYRATSQFSIGKSSSSHYQGRIYSLIVRMAASTATQISNTENYVNSKTKAY